MGLLSRFNNIKLKLFIRKFRIFLNFIVFFNFKSIFIFKLIKGNPVSSDPTFRTEEECYNLCVKPLENLTIENVLQNVNLTKNITENKSNISSFTFPYKEILPNNTLVSNEKYVNNKKSLESKTLLIDQKVTFNKKKFNSLKQINF